MTVNHAITVKLPYAAAIRASVKLVENRGRPAHYRGPVAIHAAAGWSKVGEADERIRTWWWGADRNPNALLDATDFSRMFRNIIAVADLADCHQATLDWTSREPATCCQPWGDRWYLGKAAFHLVLANVRPLTAPVPARGQLGVPWRLPADVADAVNQQVKVATP